MEFDFDKTLLARGGAAIGRLPESSGDGYGYGGGIVLFVAGLAVPFGEGEHARQIAHRLAELWNAPFIAAARETPDAG